MRHHRAIVTAPGWRGFLFDADNTIFDYDRCEREALSATLGAAGIAPSPEVLAAYHEINDALWKRFELGAVSQEELKVERFRTLLGRLGAGAEHGDPGAPAALSEGYVGRLAALAWMLPHAREALEELASRGLPLALVTNGIPAVQRGRLARSGLSGLFRAVLISGEIGIMKPDPRFFIMAAEALGLERSELLCVGDSPTSDIRGAQAAGMASCWVERPGAAWPDGIPAPDFRIRDLRELLPMAAAPAQGRSGDPKR